MRGPPHTNTVGGKAICVLSAEQQACYNMVDVVSCESVVTDEGF